VVRSVDHQHAIDRLLGHSHHRSKRLCVVHHKSRFSLRRTRSPSGAARSLASGRPPPDHFQLPCHQTGAMAGMESTCQRPSSFHGTKTKCSLLYLYPGTIPNFARDGFGVERLHGEGSAMPGNQINLNSDHNRAIRAEIGYQLRVLLSKEQSRPPPGVQRLLDFLSALDATTGRTPTTRY
jgi:hypothetical protein